MRKVIFLDKDGTLIPDLPYNTDPDRISLCRGVMEALQKLSIMDYEFIVITNQPGIELGYFPANALIAVEDKIRQLLGSGGVWLSGFYFCPHAPKADHRPVCACRKPASGLLYKAAEDLAIDLQRSWMIGDILNDVEAGNKAGCQTILMDNGNETAWLRGKWRKPDLVCADWGVAARHIVNFSPCDRL